ncbi:MAG: radical SAM protein [Candidatus Aenigmatarchaeota archaeon]
MSRAIHATSLILKNIFFNPLACFNYALACVNSVIKPSYLLNKPVSLLLEPTTKCNLRCKMCARTYWKSPKIGDMSFRNFKKIIENFDSMIGSDDIQTGLCLTGLGEPFLNKDIFKMIEYAKYRKKISYVYIISNGTVINSEVAKKIVSSGLDHLAISLDGATKETYEKIRIGANFNRVIQNIKKLVEIRNKAGKKPTIRLCFVLQRENSKDLDKVISLGKLLNVDMVSATIINPHFPNKNSLTYLAHISQIEQAYQKAKELGIKFKYIDHYTDKCLYPWVCPYITWNGFVTPCCVKPDPEEFNFGNVLENSFSSIWNSKKYKEFRKSLNSDTPPKICKGCPKLPKR